MRRVEPGASAGLALSGRVPQHHRQQVPPREFERLDEQGHRLRSADRARALEFRVTAQTTVNSGTRAELAWDSRDLEGSRAQYFFSERLDATWPDFDRVKDAKGRPTWQILAQFHDQPDCTLGETWDSYAGSGNSPPIVVQSFWLTKQDPDVRAVFGNGAESLAQRRRSMRTVSVGFVMGVATMTGNLLWQDRKASLGSARKLLLNVRDAAYLVDMVVSTLPHYLAFYRAGFHPDEVDHGALIGKWRAEVGG